MIERDVSRRKLNIIRSTVINKSEAKNKRETYKVDNSHLVFYKFIFILGEERDVAVSGFSISEVIF